MNRQLNCASRASNSLFKMSISTISEEAKEQIKADEKDEEEELTLFHQGGIINNVRKNQIGVRRWGPELSLYITELHKALESSPLSLAYALIYLDRACSIKTQRSYGQTRCPYVTPRTVHRLLLTAMVMAAKATDPETIIKSNAVGVAQYESSSKKYADKLKAFGVTEGVIAAMEASMLSALGDERTYVSEHQLHACFRTWADAMSKQSSVTMSSNNHQPRQMMMNMQAAGQHEQQPPASHQYQQQYHQVVWEQQQRHHIPATARTSSSSGSTLQQPRSEHPNHVNISPPASHQHQHQHPPYSQEKHGGDNNGNTAQTNENPPPPPHDNTYHHQSSSSNAGIPPAVADQTQQHQHRAYAQESTEDMSSATDQQDVTNSLGYYWA